MQSSVIQARMTPGRHAPRYSDAVEFSLKRGDYPGRISRLAMKEELLEAEDPEYHRIPSWAELEYDADQWDHLYEEWSDYCLRNEPVT